MTTVLDSPAAETQRMADTNRDDALEYHSGGRPGKTEVVPTKPTATQRDLSLAYTPGVAKPCLEIAADVSKVYKYTNRGNLVAVISNGTAVLGLGNIGPLAGKPVMEGKACLFKKFAGIDVYDIELAETDPDEMVKTIARLEPTFGGINLEDIKAPDCFYIERKLRERMKIPVFHDDQHGTAIVAAAAVLNGLRCVGKDIARARLVCSCSTLLFLLLDGGNTGAHNLMSRSAAAVKSCRFFHTPALPTPAATSSPRRSMSSHASPRMIVATIC
jgi:malate dehydrogenase (oxaloacetate-decarboxylating)(NADP+)